MNGNGLTKGSYKLVVTQLSSSKGKGCVGNSLGVGTENNR
jgi:hypothetical protein